MKSYKKILISILLFFFIISGIGFTNLKPVQAFSPGVVAINAGKWIWEKVGDVLNMAALRTVYKLTDYTAEYVAQQAAFQTLNWLLEEGAGKKPLFETKNASELFADTVNSAAGDFIGELADSFEDAGFEKFNLCAPSLDTKLSLTLGLLDVEKPPEPKCDFNKVVQNWKEFGETLKDKRLSDVLVLNLTKKKLDSSSYNTPAERFEAYDEYFSNIFSVTTSEVGLFLTLKEKQEERKSREAEAEKAEFARCRGMVSKKSPITETKKTDCNVLFNQFSDTMSESERKAFTTGMAEAPTWKGIPIALLNALMDAGTTYITTLTGQLARIFIQEGLLGMNILEDKDVFEDLVAKLRGGVDFSRPPRGFDIAESVKTPDFQEMPEYSLLTNYVVCPGDESVRKADHCVIDNEFLSLITKKKTIRQLIDEGSLDSNLALIGPGNPTHQSYDCYKNGLCYKNLVKLRKAGIIPIGWELAALASPDNNPVVLAEAIECFEDNRNDSGSSNPNHNCKFGREGATHNSYYHLIDEDWVLKEPRAMCQYLVYSNELQSSLSSSRIQYCADFKTCLEEDDQGNCSTTYGHCTRSENIWRFEGQACTDLYAGCLTFASDTYIQESYMQDTLEYCTSNNAGCLRYSQEKNDDDDWTLTNINTDDNDLFLNSNTNNCPENYEGCSEYIVMLPATGNTFGPNIIPNSDFELDKDNNSIPDGWSSNGVEYLEGKIKNGYSFGSSFPGTESVTMNISLLPNTIYSFSASASQVEGETESTSRIVLRGCDDNGCSDNSIAGAESNIGNCSLSAGGHPNNIDLIFTPSNTNMERDSCLFKTNKYTNSGQLHILTSGGSDTVLWFDNIQLKVVSSGSGDAVSYTSYGSGGKINLSGERIMCLAEEVGCQGYYPTIGGYMVPGTITQNDLCPTECLNYNSFAQMPSIFDETEGVYEVEYYNFIPETGASCPAQHIDCQKFTNLAAAEEGGESIEYYSFVRQCVSETLGQTYYTWEGSDVAGYQIKTWLALKSNLDNAPCTNINAGGNICQDTDSKIAICGGETSDNPYDDPEYNSNCREFFDMEGNPHWRLQDKLVFATDNCHDYRRSNSGQLYNVISSLSTSCPAQYNNCRAYKGNFANNLRRIFIDNFTDGTYDSWNSSNGNLDISNESLTNNGQSLKLSTNNHTFIRTITDSIQINKNFELSWWLKNPASINSLSFKLLANDGTELINLGEVTNIAASNWQDYKLIFNNEDFEEEDYNSLEDDSLLQVIVSGNDYIYLDNLELKETIGNIAIIKNSWQTPDSCDLPYTGYHLGCQSYFDTNGQSYNLRSFDQLCRAEAVGCTGVINTHNSDNPFAETYHAGQSSEINIPKDSLEYLVPDIDKYCPEQYQGCSALGLPVVDMTTDNIVNYNTVLRINDPDKYSTNLCTEEGLYCDKFINSKGQSYYFKYPGERLCQYKRDVLFYDTTISDYRLKSDWFKIDTLNTDNPELCPSDWVNICPDTENLCTEFIDPNHADNCNINITNPEDSQYCDITQEGDYKSYYYFNNNDIDKTSCAGQADVNSGCMLFYNVNNWNADHSEVIVLYDSEQTYANNSSIDSPVSPVACDPSNPTCLLDSNELIKVEKDRKCSEWLACKSVTQVTDNNGEIKNICDAVGVCTEYNYNASDSFRTCAQWAQYTNLDDDILDNVSPLTVKNYQERIANNYLAWSDDEYLSYSIPNMFPVESLVSYNFKNIDGDVISTRLVVNGGPQTACNDPGPGETNDRVSCTVVKDTITFYGECAQERCWLNPKLNNEDDVYYGISTRGYIIEEAPFPAAVINTTSGETNPNYQRAEVCNSEYPSGCETIYKKISYGLNYFQYLEKDEDPLPMVCSEGSPNKLGKTCATDDDCLDNVGAGYGTCSSKTKIEKYYNWPGICVEYDQSPKGSNIVVDLNVLEEETRIPNLCSQWYPSESISGTDSLYDNYSEAGYYNSAGNIYFCSVGSPYLITEDRLYCGYLDGDNCNLLMLVPKGSRINVNAMVGNFDLLDNSNNPAWLLDDDTQYDYYGPGTSQADAVGDPIIVSPNPAENLKFIRAQFGNIASGDYKDTLESLFDPSSSNIGIIKYFYYDEDVKADGSQAGGNSSNNVYSEFDHAEYEDCCRDGLDTSASAALSCTGSVTGMHMIRGTCSNGSWCSSFPFDRDDDCATYWNPLAYNYYVQSGGGDAEDIIVCTEQDCSGPSKGIECLEDSAIFNLIDPVTAPLDYAAKACLIAAETANNYCSDYSEESSPGAGDGCEDLIMNNSGYIVSEAFGMIMYNENNNGCLQSDIETGCTTEEQGGDYITATTGTSCNGISCYQQCDIVVEVATDGSTYSDNSRSIVRTDIWWRGKENSEVNEVNWAAYYYTPASLAYITHTDIAYSKINGQSVDSNYGAVTGSTNNYPILTEVPFDNVFANFDRNFASPIFFGPDTSTAQAQLEKLFRQIHNLKWSIDAYLNYGSPEIGENVSYFPYIYKVDCLSDDSCTVGDEGIVVEYDESGNATVKLYYYAHPDAMPIQFVGIYWGDSLPTVQESSDSDDFNGTYGKYKNKLPFCDSTLAMPHSSSAMQGFGGTVDACSEAYKVFQHNYIYQSDHLCDGTGGKPEYSGASCYQPSVRIEDWWENKSTITYDSWIVVEL